jgi:adenylate cyclase
LKFQSFIEAIVAENTQPGWRSHLPRRILRGRLTTLALTYRWLVKRTLFLAIEIERKFLLANDGWRSQVIRSDYLRDGLIARSGTGKVRVRITPEKAWLTVKGPRHGISRSEFEYEIPLLEAEEILTSLCEGPAIEKMRYVVPYFHLLWSVDVHMGPLAGVEFAEVELRQEDELVPMPPWAGTEVTNDPHFRKETLLRRCVEAATLSRLGKTGHSAR